MYIVLSKRGCLAKSKDWPRRFHSMPCVFTGCVLQSRIFHESFTECMRCVVKRCLLQSLHSLGKLCNKTGRLGSN